MKKNKMLDFVKKNYKILILIVFVGLAVLIGSHHEMWADETQAWLIAKDTNLYTLFSKYLHAEGHPALWYLVLKFFQFIKLPVKYIFIIPIIFSTIGVYVFLYKSIYPWYLKCMLPFTYFIFYQYTIVVRSYCLIFPLLMILASLWEEKDKKNNLYTIILILLISCESYTYVFTFMIWIYDIYNFFIKKSEYTKKGKNKLIKNFVIIFMSFILTALYVFPYSTTEILSVLRWNNYYLSDSFFTSFYETRKYIKLTLTFLIIIYLYYIYNKDRKKLVKFIVFFVPVILLFFLICVRPWHYGIVLILFIFLFWIDRYENKKEIKVFLIIVCIIQIPWSVKNSYFDYKELCSSAEIASSFVKQYNKNMDIMGIGFNANSVNFYFKNNIFSNWDDNIRFFYLDSRNKYFGIDTGEETIFVNNYDMIIFEKQDYINEDLLLNYNFYQFDGYTYFEGRKLISQTFIVYVRKDIDNLKESND